PTARPAAPARPPPRYRRWSGAWAIDAAARAEGQEVARATRARRSARLARGAAMQPAAGRVRRGKMRILPVLAVRVEVAVEHRLHRRRLDTERMEAARALGHDIVVAQHVDLVDGQHRLDADHRGQLQDT